jgi:chromosome segregation ATPase
LSKAKNESEKIETDIKKNNERIITIEETTKNLKEEIKRMQKEKDDDGKLGGLQEQYKEIQKEETKRQSELENINSTVKSDQKRKNEINKIINDVR